MAQVSDESLPDLAQVLGQLLARVPAADQPLLIALAERLAADRYRGWAAESMLAGHRDTLLECAAREEEIAGRVEALRPDAEAVQRDLQAKNPDLMDINRSLFAGLPLAQQLRLQSRGERLGASTWRALAQGANADTARMLEGCAELEEQNAGALDAILARV